MALHLRDLPDLVCTSLGRAKCAAAWNYASFPLFAPVAALYRRLVVRKTRIIAVVGSQGKTTAQSAVCAVLGLPDNGRDNRNSWSDVAWRLLRVRPRTPRAVFEVGIAKPGQMRHYARILRPQVTVVTTIGSDHNRSLPSLEVTRWEKAAMVRALSAEGLAVLNGDDPNVVWMKGETKARTIFYGFGAANDVRAEEFAVDWPHGARFTLHAGGQRRQVRSRLHGRHMVYPLLAAIAVAIAEGVDLDAAVSALESLKPVAGRMEMLLLQNGARLLCDDYKASQESFFSALDAFEQIPARRRIVVLGDVGEPVGSKHRLYREIGKRVGCMASRAILIGSSRMRDTARGAISSGMSPDAITGGSDVGVLKAAELLRAELCEGDVVLIKGRTTDRLRRVILALQGRQVRCDIRLCQVGDMECDACNRLESG
ncbi:Mur ligase family protein [Prosthecobacter sp.]|uniref:Mur ligase family protein n=1 Tax=Prosthecobacter sp. TaxID=1965333 RepID=UPI001DA46C8B|nr:Mur ligase family protein [Prosthecobacter sp.]MCB1278754.1 hypothetical protein [Prosthecobacter sp.]